VWLLLIELLSPGGAVGFIVALGFIAQIKHEHDTWTAAALGIIPLPSAPATSSISP